MKTNYINIIAPIADHALNQGIYSRHDKVLTQAIKTAGYYERTFERVSLSYYDDETEENEAIAILLMLLASQIRRAYIEGLREAGHDPNHMTGAMYAEIDAAIASESAHVYGLIDDIKKAKEAGEPFAPFTSRIETWANRFKDLVNRGILAGAVFLSLNVVWNVGPTEHCVTCVALDQTVATALQWQLSGYRPQHPPNTLLDCGGWRCQCSLSPTTAAATIQDDGIIGV